MGHLFSSDSSTERPPEAHPSNNCSKDNRHNKKNKNAKPKRKNDDSAWDRAARDFTQSLLSREYLHLPLRGNTVTAASLYEASAPHCMPGSHKHLGGAYDPQTGCIYGIPANAPCLLCLTPVYHQQTVTHYKPTSIPLPESIRHEKMKWLRGIVHDGYLWAIPSGASAILCVELSTQTIQLVPLPTEYTVQPWQWHGGGLLHHSTSNETSIYCVPSNAQQVLKINVHTRATSLLPIDASRVCATEQDCHDLLALPNKWYGGIVGNDGCLYGIPYRCHAVLQIAPNDHVRLLPVTTDQPDVSATLKPNHYNWHGGINVNGKIYAHPSHANTVLVIDTTNTTTTTTTTTSKVQEEAPGIPEMTQWPILNENGDYWHTSSERNETYKWLGGAVGTDGNIYCPACDTTAVLKLDVTQQTAYTYGAVGTSKNKWQGGVRSPQDGCIYCIPANGIHVLRILPDGKTVQLIGELPPHKDKWQGGSVGLDGCLYFIPENGYRVLKVIPPARADDDNVQLEFV